MTTMTIYELTKTDAAETAWADGDNAGNGYAVGSDDGDVNGLADEIGMPLARSADRDDQVAVYHDGGARAVLVGDSHGPWAVDVEVEVGAGGLPAAVLDQLDQEVAEFRPEEGGYRRDNFVSGDDDDDDDLLEVVQTYLPAGWAAEWVDDDMVICRA